MASSPSQTRYVGFWLRVWAVFIDSVLVAVLVVPILITAYGWEYFDSETVVAGPVDFLVSWVLPALGVVLFWIFKLATPGKMAVSARIVDARTGARPSNGQLIGRYFAYFVSMLPIGLGFAWIAFDGRKQGWHDKLAGTVVVRPDIQRSLVATFDSSDHHPQQLAGSESV